MATKSLPSDEEIQTNLAKAYRLIFKTLQSQYQDPVIKSNMDGSAERTAKAIREMCFTDDKIYNILQGIMVKDFPLTDTFENSQRGIVNQGPIQATSMCPHHLLPITYKAYVSYLPSGSKVLGLSKLARIVKALSHRPVLQEQLAKDIADVLYYHETLPFFETEGSAVALIGQHNCMLCRGVESDALTSSLEVRGVYYEKDFEEKFLAAISMLKDHWG